MLRERIGIVNASLMDEQSKKIFGNRLMFSLTADYQYIKNLQNKEYLNKDKEYILWGRGYWAKEIIDCYPGIKWRGVCDNNFSAEEEFAGIKVISPSQMIKEHCNCDVVIATRKFWHEIEVQLKNMGIKDEQIVNMGREQELLAGKIYFDLPYLTKSGKEEVFIDGGCYDGATIDGFLMWSRGNYKKIYAFEPDADNAKKCNIHLKQNHIKDTEICNFALTDKSKMVWFNEEGSALSGADENGKSEVRGIALQDYLTDEYATFIKLDIEGMELEALTGMKKIIMRDKPHMAISVYHKNEDILEIPLFLLSINPDYRFYLRHYSIGVVDTVLYAVNYKEK